MQVDGFAGDARKLLRQRLCLRRSQCHGGDSGDRQNVMILVVAGTVGSHAIRKMLGVAFFREDLQKIKQIGMQLPTKAAVQNTAALGFAEIGGGQKPQKIRLCTETFVQNLQLLQDLLIQPFVSCQIVQRFAVNGSCLRHT